VIIFKVGNPSSFSVYSLVLVFFCRSGALRDWDLTSLGGGRLTLFRFALLDLLILLPVDERGLLLEEKLLEEPLEEPLAGPLMGAIVKNYSVL
jgi:hypothetical protein